MQLRALPTILAGRGGSRGHHVGGMRRTDEESAATAAPLYDSWRCRRTPDAPLARAGGTRRRPRAAPGGSYRGDDGPDSGAGVGCRGALYECGTAPAESDQGRQRRLRRFRRRAGDARPVTGASSCGQWTWASWWPISRRAMDRIASVAANMGGWTVSSERSDDFSGKVAVRVPADRLDEAVAQVRGAATAVEWEISTSEDVTAEYYDSQSRIRNLRATETAMLNLLERAPDAEDALAIRNSLTEVQRYQRPGGPAGQDKAAGGDLGFLTDKRDDAGTAGRPQRRRRRPTGRSASDRRSASRRRSGRRTTRRPTGSSGTSATAPGPPATASPRRPPSRAPASPPP